MPNVKDMAHLFVNGPDDVRGRWDQSATRAGYVRIPSKQNETVLAAIDAAREKQTAAKFAAMETALAEADDSTDWTALATKIMPLYAQIGMGTTRATATQVSTMKDIMLRGFGRVVEKQQDLTPSAVIILPTLGADGNAQVCPKCKHELTQDEGVADKALQHDFKWT